MMLPESLPADRQPVREQRRQAGSFDLTLRCGNVVLDAAVHHRCLAVIVQQVRRTRIAVARLSDAAGIEDEARVRQRDDLAIVSRVQFGATIALLEHKLHVRVADKIVSRRLQRKLRLGLFLRKQVLPRRRAKASVHEREVARNECERQRGEERPGIMRQLLAAPQGRFRGDRVELLDSNPAARGQVVIAGDTEECAGAQRSAAMTSAGWAP